MLETPFRMKGLEVRNRIVMAPMCQYSVAAKDGIPNEWHFVHYVSRAVGGAGLIIVEMTDVEPDGRITDYDLGLWSDKHIPAFQRIVNEVHKHGAKIGVQIAHAGRKAQDAEVPVGPSDIPATENSKKPRPLATAEVKAMIGKFRDAAKRAVAAGVDTIELHGAHGYLIHQFHSPAINTRDDEYGRDSAKFGVEIIKAVKEVMPAEMPLLFRISAVEYMNGGYDIDHALAVAEAYRDAGVDVFHVSSGGEGPAAGIRKPGNYPGYQVPMARAFKQKLGVPVIAVGMLDDPQLAEATVSNGDADLIGIARGLLRDPYWAIHAIQSVTGKAVPPRQYERAFV